MVTVACWEGATPKIETSVEMIIHTWNLFVLDFFGLQPSKRKDFSNQHRGHLRVPGIDVYWLHYWFVSCFMFFWVFKAWFKMNHAWVERTPLQNDSFYIFQYLFHDGVLSTRQTLPLVMCHMHESALVMSQRLRVKPRDLLGSSSLGGDFFPKERSRSSTIFCCFFWTLSTFWNLNEKKYYVNMYVW